jgi:hypothetical protein
MTFIIYALTCSLLVARPDCQLTNARNVLQLGEASNEIWCGMKAQEALAQLAGMPLADDEYWKIVCRKVTSQGSVG